jgi:hypothetical protein
MNQFKKYAPGVYCIMSENDSLQHDDEVTVTTRHGKEVECTIWKKLFTRYGMTYYSYLRNDGLNRSAWMQRKADRRAAAAEKSKQRSDEYYNKSNKHRDFLSLGEPIKIGHHSEKRHRRMIEEAGNNMRKSWENSEKAKEQAYKAESLAIKAESEINLDTPECLEALREKLSTLESKREAIKKHNKENPKEKYDSFYLSNLGANIRRYKERLKVARNLWEIQEA